MDLQESVLPFHHVGCGVRLTGHLPSSFPSNMYVPALVTLHCTAYRCVFSWWTINVSNRGFLSPVSVPR